jgi:hypothetical protein
MLPKLRNLKRKWLTAPEMFCLEHTQHLNVGEVAAEAWRQLRVLQ